MNNIKFPWIPTDEYLKILREDIRYIEVEARTIVDEINYSVFLQNMKWYQEENSIPYSVEIHCFRLIRELETEKYFKHLFKLETEVYLLFEEKSRYTYSNSPELYSEERLRQGISEKEIKERGTRYHDYMSLADEGPQI